MVNALHADQWAEHAPEAPASLARARSHTTDQIAGSCEPARGHAHARTPLVLDEAQANSPAIVEAWFGGVEGANGVADALYGKVNPGGKLPVSFPRNVGQVPIYYNHQPTAVRATRTRNTTRGTATSSAARRSRSSATA